jgi:hypothetical protein
VTRESAVVALVIQTASVLLEGRLAPQEAVTILATQAPQAKAASRRLGRTEPERAAIYAELLRSIASELRERALTTEQPGSIRAVEDDLEAIADGLQSADRG